MDRARPQPLYRRNGRPQACEPCRMRKVGCDHAQPVCSRCIRSGKPETCKYALNGPVRGGSHESRTPISVPSPALQPDTDATASVRGTSTSKAISSSTGATGQLSPPTSTNSNAGSQARNNASNAVGYLGFSSFGRTLDEARSSLSLLRPWTGTSFRHHETEYRTIAEDDPPCTLSESALRTCVVALLNVPEQEKGEELINSLTLDNDGWSPLTARHILAAFYDTFGQFFKGDRNEIQMAELARVIWSNTGKPYSDEESDAVLWMNQFSGRNLRWETLGILFTYWERGAMLDSAGAPSAACRCTATKMRTIYRECFGYCLELAKAASKASNTLMLYIYSRRVISESIFTGDATLSCWQYHAESVALMTFLGLHVDSSSKPYTPTLASEVRRRLFAYIFNVDKMLASFTGRPPLMSRRFTSTPPPLDLQDEDLLSDKATIALKVKSLDQNGFNTEGRFNPATILRTRLRISTVRDDLFELIASNGVVNSVESLLDIKAREMQIMVDLPTGLGLDISDSLSGQGKGSGLLNKKLIFHLDHLINLFLVERFLHRHGYDNNSELLSVSFDMLSTTLLYWIHRDEFTSVHVCASFVAMAYAAPGGGVLCLELLKPTLGGSHPTNPKITRSSIIQQLSLFVGFLDWISPSAPNSSLCADCKTVVQHVLDQTLNPSPASQQMSNSIDWDFSTQMDFNFDLLDTFDWLRQDFVSSQQSS